jgi:hypothetical protein
VFVIFVVFWWSGVEKVGGVVEVVGFVMGDGDVGSASATSVVGAGVGAGVVVMNVVGDGVTLVSPSPFSICMDGADVGTVVVGLGVDTGGDVGRGVVVLKAFGRGVVGS